MTETTTTDTAAAAPKKSSGGLGGKVLAELQEIAKDLGIDGTSMRKGALIDAIKQARGDAPAAPKQASDAPAAPKQASDAPAAPKQASDAPKADTAEKAEKVEAGEKPAKADKPAKQNKPAKADKPADDATSGDDKSGTKNSDKDGDTNRQNNEGGGRNNNRNNNRQQNNEGGGRNSGNQNQGNQNKGDQNKGDQNKGNQGDQNRQQQNNNDDDDLDGNGRRRNRRGRNRNNRGMESEPTYSEDDVLVPAAGILDILDNYAFVRTTGYLPSENDVYVSLSMVRKWNLRRGDAVTGQVRQPREGERKEKFNPMVKIETVNGMSLEESAKRVEFSKLTPLYPSERLRLEGAAGGLTGRVIDLVSPIGKGQRGLIVSPPRRARPW